MSLVQWIYVTSAFKSNLLYIRRTHVIRTSNSQGMMVFVRITQVFELQDLKFFDLIFHENDGGCEKMTHDMQ